MQLDKLYGFHCFLKVATQAKRIDDRKDRNSRNDLGTASEKRHWLLELLGVGLSRHSLEEVAALYTNLTLNTSSKRWLNVAESAEMTSLT